jgi:hypothetical protein
MKIYRILFNVFTAINLFGLASLAKKRRCDSISGFARNRITLPFTFTSKASAKSVIARIVVVLISTMFLILPIRIGKSDCGIGGRAGKIYSFVNADIMQMQSDYAPYLMGYGVIGDYYRLESRFPESDDNIGEWRGRFCDIPDSADIDYVIYEATQDELADLREATSTRFKNKEIYYQLEKNTFAQVIKQNGCTDVVDYLLFAKSVEKYCVKGDEWSETPKDVAQMFFWINQGRQQFKNTKSPFLKLRYAYQMVRLAHYAKDYQAVLRIYDDVMPKTEKINSIINYWILAHKAGALKSLGKKAEAAYLFAVVFRYSPSKRRQAFESFSVTTENEWQLCLNYCRDNRERAALYAIRASYDKAHALEDMVSLYNLDPTNEHLEMLLIRETLRLEKVLIGHNVRRQRYAPEVVAKNKQYCALFRDYVKKIADAKAVKNVALWRTTEGYLTLLVGNWRESLRTFQKARTIVNNDVLEEQLNAFELAARIIGLQGTDEGMDSEIAALRKTDAYLSDPDFDNLFQEKMGSIYKANGNTGIAFLCDYQLPHLEKNPKLDLINNLIALCQKPTKSLFERELLMSGGNKTIESQLWNIKGRYHLARFEMEAANEAFKNVPEAEQGKKYTPFVDKIKDCVNCVQSDTVLVTRAEFAQKMLDLEYQARMNMSNSSDAFFKLGLGYYNMTYFGNSSGLADYYRSGISWRYLNSGNNAYPLSNFPLGNAEMTDVSLALQYFEKARQLTQDRELQARCAFWCAKCEQNMFFTDKMSDYNVGGKNVPSVPRQYRRYFKLLNEYYADTQFYKQAQTECKYFQFYKVK